MRPEALLAGVAVAVLFATVGVALLVPGFVAEPDSDEPPARLDVTETTLETGNVTGETATFDVTAFLTHRGGTATNVSVVVRAVDDSGVVADTARADRQRLEGGGEHEVPVSVTVPREGGYEIWHVKASYDPTRSLLHALGIYVAFTGVFVHVLQIVARQFMDR